MKTKIEKAIESHFLRISPTTTDKRQFETNVRCDYICEQLTARLKFLEYHESCIGKDVYKYKSGINVIANEDIDETNKKDARHFIFNPIMGNAFKYTKKHFDELQLEYIKYQMQRIEEGFVTQSLFANSTNPFSNLENEWIIESKQYLHKFFSELV